ncbi:putative periplasmic serine endoprotease DegP-like [Burkholderiales bacterium 8X]|nr:putative periplasmic serine endoprotease DegP-like [Burkholderiales bacterium 8X]
MHAAMKAALSLILAASLAGCGSTHLAAPAEPRSANSDAAPLRDANADLATARRAAWVAARTASVVDISTLRLGRDESQDEVELEFAPENDFADRLASPLAASMAPSQIRDLASGVILASDGYILTSAHVVRGIDDARVRLADGRRFEARVIGVDRRTDIALIKIDAAGLPAASIGDSSTVAPGDWVAAIGAPFGFRGSVTTGVVSAVGRYVGGAGQVPFIQTDVAINPGSSGSPLFNERGEVVGINSMIYSGTGGYMGLSFAVPIDLAIKTAAALRENGRVRRARLGAEFQELTRGLSQSFGWQETRGALTVQVEPGSPAERSGLRRGDIVSSLDGAAVTHFTDLVQRLGEQSPGASVRLGVWRGGRSIAIPVRLEAEAATVLPPPSRDAIDAGTEDLGLSLAELTPVRRSQLRIDGGLLVRSSVGVARIEGIRAGDLLLAVNDSRLEKVEDFRRAVASVPRGRGVALLVMRDRRLAYVAVPLPAPAR